KALPAFSTSFFPLAYLCTGQPIPEKADAGIRALMVQDATGYTNNHVAATFHASHYYSLVGEETPKAAEMVTRILREQKPDGSWLATGCADGLARVFDAYSGVPRLTFKAHTGIVAAVQFSPDSQQLVTGSYDHDAIIWDAAKAKIKQTFSSHRSAVVSVAFS